MDIFLNPSLLLGALAAGVPIVLHLIMRQHPRLLEFPALRFVKQRQMANERRLKLRHLLLLILRAGALCLLALALARPSLKSAGGLVDRAAPVAAAMVFDTSPRMQYRDQNQTRLQAAQETAQWLLKQLPEDSQAAVLESRPAAAVFQVDLGAAQQRIERLETTAVPQPLARTLAEAAQLLATSELPNREIYVFTDLAAASWKPEALEQLRDELKKLKEAGIYVIDVGVEKPQNFALGEVRLSSQMLSKNSPLVIGAQVTRQGPSGDRSLELRLFEQDKDGQGKPLRVLKTRGTQTVTVADGASRPAEFRLGGLDVGTHQGVVRLMGEDALSIDDVRYFTLDVRPAWPVLIAAPSPAEENAFFLAEAIDPEDFRKTGRSRFKPTIVALDELSKQQLEQYAAVCVLDPSPLSPLAWQKLRDFAAAGGGLAIFLGRNAAPVESFNSPLAQEVLPGQLLQQARTPDGQLSPDNYDHPLLAKFRPLAGGVPWDGFPVFRYWQLDKLQAGVNVVMEYADDRPAILERPVGKGRVLTMTTPVSDPANSDSAWNLLPTNFEPWPFLMLANESLLYLVGSTEGQLNYYAGQTAVLKLDAADTSSTYLLSLPPKAANGPTTEAPADEQLRRTVDAKLHAVVETSTDRPGNYRVGAGGAGGLDRGFSVNLPAEASDLARTDEKRLKEFFGEHPFKLARDREQIERDRMTSRVGSELFPIIIFLVALFLGLEHVLANRFYNAGAKEQRSKGAKGEVIRV